MATPAHCIYCFEVLSANYSLSQPPSLAEVETQWNKYLTRNSKAKGNQAIDRLLSSASPASSTPSLISNTSSVTEASSILPTDKYPLFVTWDKVDSRTGQKSLRGCIGTFEARSDLEDTLKSYTLISALQDHRFNPIPSKDLPALEVSVTLLTNFEKVTDPLDWEIGKHGVRITFLHKDKRGRESRTGATYLPDVIKEQGWTKDQALDSLISKALDHQQGHGSWRQVKDLQLTRYLGSKESLDYEGWSEFREWTARAS